MFYDFQSLKAAKLVLLVNTRLCYIYIYRHFKMASQKYFYIKCMYVQDLMSSETHLYPNNHGFKVFLLLICFRICEEVDIVKLASQSR